ncbi:hypothetical protein [Thomasclavelia cocleata]|nr:hypothetical protein [Thomasclavelia cocleata]
MKRYAYGTTIQICSLQYDICYYQEEAMVVAMLNWCSYKEPGKMD